MDHNANRSRRCGRSFPWTGVFPVMLTLLFLGLAVVISVITTGFKNYESKRVHYCNADEARSNTETFLAALVHKQAFRNDWFKEIKAEREFEMVNFSLKGMVRGAHGCGKKISQCHLCGMLDLNSTHLLAVIVRVCVTSPLAVYCANTDPFVEHHYSKRIVQFILSNCC